jgi:hypothetical protein
MLTGKYSGCSFEIYSATLCNLHISLFVIITNDPFFIKKLSAQHSLNSMKLSIQFISLFTDQRYFEGNKIASQIKMLTILPLPFLPFKLNIFVFYYPIT